MSGASPDVLAPALAPAAPATPAERALQFTCEGEHLLGILSLPAAPGRVGVVIVVGGPQYRAGSHRQFVLLARSLARSGYATLRFDHRGMGDSTGALRSFEDLGADIHAAVDALCDAAPEVRQVVLWGLCDGASAALLAVDRQRDPRIAGLALLNPWVRSESGMAKTHVKHYYLERLRQRSFWTKLLSGRIAASAITGLASNLRKAWAGERADPRGSLPFQQRMARAWLSFTGPILLLLSERDLTAREFLEYSAADAAWQQALAGHAATRVDIADADHTCSQPQAQQALEGATARWLGATWPQP